MHAEAEVLEHVLSEELEELIAAKLGEPTHDPHGDPIPAADGTRRRAADTVALDALEPRRPRDRSSASPTATRSCFASSTELGIRPGDRIVVIERALRRSAVGPRRHAGHVLGAVLARAMRVEIASVTQARLWAAREAI